MGGIVLILPGENFDQTNRYKYMELNRMHLNLLTTVKTAHAVTSFRQSPALKGHVFLVL